jgi:hypothetical protein
MEEATGAPSSFAVYDPRRLRASGRDGGGVMSRPPSPLTMLLSRHTRRREFIGGLGGAAAWPLVARAQQSKTAVIGLLGANSVDTNLRQVIPAVRRGLSETGYFEGRNFAFEHRGAEGHLERLPALADNLVCLKVAAIIATSHAPALAAQAATKSIPIIFFVGSDPVDTGLVGSLNRPGGNLTGVAGLGTAGWGKRVQLLHELVPTASIAYPTHRSLRLRRVHLASGRISLMYAIKVNSKRLSWHS